MIAFEKLKCVYKILFNPLLNTTRIQIQLFQRRNASEKASKVALRNQMMDELAKDRDFEELDVKMFSQLIKDNETEEKVELILSKYEYEKYTTLRVPKTLTIENMSDLLRCKGFFERKSSLSHFFIKEIRKLKSDEKHRDHSEKYWTQKKEKWSQIDCPKTGLFDNKGNLVYGLWHNSLVSRIYKSHVNKLYVNGLRNAALFGEKLIIDLDYDNYMSITECQDLAKQIELSLRLNKYETKDPFDIQFTNCDMNGLTLESIKKRISNWNSSSFMSQFKTQSYLDLFPNERLVYLSPNADTTLKYSFDDIYIIGGFVDKRSQEAVSYVKAKREGIRCARLPIDDHLNWGTGSKSLCINHVVSALNIVKMCGDWRQALENAVPKRKIKSAQVIAFEESLRISRLRRRKNLENKS